MNRLRLRPPRSRTKTNTKEPERESTTGLLGYFYTVEFDRAMQRDEVVKIHGLALGKRFFRFPARSRFGGEPAAARITSMTKVFKTARAASGSLKLHDGFAIDNYGRGKIVPVKYTKNADGSLVARDKDGSHMRGVGNVATSRKQLVKQRMRELNDSIKSKTKEAREEAQSYAVKIRELKSKRARALKSL